MIRVDEYRHGFRPFVVDCGRCGVGADAHHFEVYDEVGFVEVLCAPCLGVVSADMSLV